MSSTRDPKEPTAEELKEQKFYGFEEDVSGIVVPQILPLLPLRRVWMIPYLPDELQVVVMNIKDPGKVTDLVSSNLNISLEEKQDLLNTIDVRSRLEKLSAILNREIELLELGHKIQSQVQTELNKNQKEFYLRQQLKAIQKELGEGDGKSAEVEELRRRVEEAKMPPEALKAAEHELE